MNRSENAISPFRLVQDTARRQWLKGLAFFIGTLTLVTAAAVFWGNTYRSDARIFVRLGRESVSMDPTVSTSGAITVNETREVEINSVLEILQSRDLAERVVDKLGEEAILTGRPPDENSVKKQRSAFSELMAKLRVLKDGRAVSIKERAITSLLRGLKVWSPKKTTVIGIEYSSESPEVAQMVVTEVIDAFKSEHARVNRTEGSYEFLREQAELLEKKLLESQNAMRDAKNKTGLVSIEGHKQLLQDELSLLETQLINANSDLSGSRARLLSLERASTVLPERQETEGVIVADDATSRMREALYEVQLRERELATKYNEGHPTLKRAQEQSRQAQEIYDAQSREREQTTTGMNPARQQIELAVLTERANFESLQAKCDSLNEQRKAATLRMQALNTDEVQLAELQRKVEHAESNFRNYAERMEIARLDQQLENERISNVNTIQPASFIEKPASPNRLLLLSLGVVFATCGSIGVMMLAEFSSPRVKAEQEYPEVFLPRSPLSPASSWHEESALHS